jgi:hypothetical protein
MLALLVPDAGDSDESWTDCPFCCSQEEPYSKKLMISFRSGKTHANCTPDDTVEIQLSVAQSGNNRRLHRNSNKLREFEAAHEVDEWELRGKLSNVKNGRGPCELVAPQVQVGDKTIH